MSKYFPIKSETSCKLKWAWSTLYLNSGSTASCHRASFSNLSLENFNDFHNTEAKISARELMLAGKWPRGGCEYCQGIEQSGGSSDRMLQNSIPGLFPDQAGTVVDPAILEVYFNNTCNLACLYCRPDLSSSIDQENNKFGVFDRGGVRLEPLNQKHIQEFEPAFWNWAKDNFVRLERFHFLGGEPFYQKQFDKFLDFVEQHPAPDCEFNIVTNLMVPATILRDKTARIKRIMSQRKLKRFDITVSIDCWGPQQEYVRYGLDLNTWLENFTFLLNQKWIKLNINQTISTLTIKTMPELIGRLNEWRTVRPVGHYFSVTEPGPSYLRPNILGPHVFDRDFDLVLNLMPNNTQDEQRARQYMSGIANEINSSSINVEEVAKLFVFLNEKDRRRGTNWQELFPWLTQFKHYVV